MVDIDVFALSFLVTLSFSTLEEYGNVTFLSLNKKVTKEVSQRGATKKRPLWKPQPLLHPTGENVPIFTSLQGENFQAFEL